jgi:hypothetical protein
MADGNSPKMFKKRGVYFQVPISAFAFPGTDKIRLNHIIHFGCRYVGLARLAKDDKADECLGGLPSLPLGYKPDNPTHHALLVGARTIAVIFYDMRGIAEELVAFDAFLRRVVSIAPGPDATVRIKQDLVFEARNKKGISYRDLTVLAAIFSIIGRRRHPVRITQSSIRCRARGCRSKKVLEALTKAGLELPPPLTDWQLRAALERLRSSKLVHRFTFNRRSTYYGVGMSNSEFTDQVLDRLTSKNSREFQRRIDDDELTAAILNRRAALKGMPPPRPEALPRAERRLDPLEIPF